MKTEKSAQLPVEVVRSVIRRMVRRGEKEGMPAEGRWRAAFFYAEKFSVRTEEALRRVESLAAEGEEVAPGSWGTEDELILDVYENYQWLTYDREPDVSATRRWTGIAEGIEAYWRNKWQ